ncbi:hypothetical protein L7F22_026533 [Adiantum nelumboides]|nr:hypothetical protein [Adiantum nelumboides]
MAWIGFIAEFNEEETQRLGRRDIVVAFCVLNAERIEDFIIGLANFPASPRRLPAQKCTTASLTSRKTFEDVSMRDQMLNKLCRFLFADTGAMSSFPVSITMKGNTLGSALALLAACDIGVILRSRAAASGWRPHGVGHHLWLPL